VKRAAQVLVLVGTLALVGVLGGVHAAQHDYSFTGTFRFWWLLAYVGALGLAAYGLGFPNLVAGRGAWRSATAAVAVAAVSISLVALVVGSALLPRFVVFGALALVPWYVACAAFASRGAAGAVERDRVALVAEPVDVDAVRDDLVRAPERPAQVVGALTPQEAATSNESGVRPLVALVAETRATLVVLSQAAQADETIVAQAAELHELGVRVRTLSDFCATWLGKLPITELERMSLLFDIGDLHAAGYARWKRLSDVVVGSVGLLALATVTPLVLLGNLVGNRGPLLYRQTRVGRDGDELSILKFRTMRAVEGHDENRWTMPDDPRITRFGRVLRRLHVDELPQVVNILRGDLSVVGPRPEQPRYVAELSEKIPFYRLRHLARPGLTGWAQVKYPYGSDEGDALEKLQYEFFYLRHQSLVLDLRVLRRTVGHVVGLGGR